MKYESASILKVEKKLTNAFEDSLKKRKGIFLTGGTGTGKTYALNAFRKYIAEMQKGDCRMKNWNDVLLELKERMSYLREALGEMLDSTFLVLDDLGTEKQTEWAQEMLYIIINKAYEREKIVYIATNLSIEDFAEKYGDRIFSRLMEMCSIYELKGEDRRI